MAGGKETPRQKMIGMMYLVLTALLALNVSKQIVAAFITLNNKLDNSAEIIDIKSRDAYGQIDQKKAALRAMGGNLDEVNLWQSKAVSLKSETASIISFVLGECNDMIEEAEGEDWVAERDTDGNIVKLKSLEAIENMDNYDIPTNMFVGSNPEDPNDRGMELVHRIHMYRDALTSEMGTYSVGTKEYEFTAPNSRAGLATALGSANPDDTSSISQMYRTLTIPEQLFAHGEEELMPWVSVTFDHAPIVAAAAMFTSLKLDIKNAESMGANFYASKINAPIFTFNDIKPMAIAQSAYINQGDSLGLQVMIAAVDTNDKAVIRYGIDSDTIKDRWVETSGQMQLSGRLPGAHKVKGVIGVTERGERKWRPWEFDYTVGQPMGVVAQPNMRVLYWGYSNVVEATASGFPSENVSMSGRGCRVIRDGNQMIAKVERGTRSATISVNAKKDDGSSMNLGSFQYKCVPLPKPELKLSGIEDGSTVSYTQARNANKATLTYDQSVTLTGVRFTIVSGTVTVDRIPGVGKINQNGSVDSETVKRLKQSAGKRVNVEVKFRDPSGITQIR